MPRHLTMMTAFALALSGPALAQTGWGAGLLFDRLDADGNGEVSLAEITAARQAQFDRVDANGDGAVTLDELGAAQDRLRRFVELPGADPAERLRRQDRDGDGRLSRDEFSAVPPALLLIDADGNGAISRAEFDRAMSVLSRTP